MTARTWAALAAYVAVAGLANGLTSAFGIVPVGLGLTVAAGTFAAGLALCLRDVLHEVGGWRLVLVGIVAGTALSFLTGSPAIAAASAAAFLLAELLDLVVYVPLRRADRWRTAVVLSNTAGGVVDSVVFLALSGLGVTVSAVAGQVVVKAVLVTALFLLVAEGVRRVVLRQRVEPAGA